MQQMKDWELEMYSKAVVDKARLLTNARLVNHRNLGRRRTDQAATDTEAKSLLVHAGIQVLKCCDSGPHVIRNMIE